LVPSRLFRKPGSRLALDSDIVTVSSVGKVERISSPVLPLTAR